MNTSSFIGLLDNAALLVALGLVFDLVVLKPGFEKFQAKVLSGFVFGVLGVAVMLTPWEFTPGVFFDTRSVILSIGGLFFGAIPTAIAVLMTAILRYIQGGAGTWTGIAVIISSAALGILWRYKRKRELDHIRNYEFYLFGIVVHINMLLWMLSLPSDIAKVVLANISIPVMVLYPIGTTLMGRLLIGRIARKKQRDELSRSEERWRSLTENSPDHVLTLDKELNIEFANFSSPGLTIDSLIGTPLYGYIEDERKQVEVKRILTDVLRTGIKSGYETVYSAADGNVIHYESMVIPRIVEGTSEIEGLTVCTRDISDRKKHETSLTANERLMREVLNGIEKAIAIYDPVDEGNDFRFLDVNEFAEKIMHYKKAEVIGKTIGELFPGEASVGLIEKLQETLLTGNSTTIPLKQYKDERITQWVENFIFKLPSGKVVAMFEDTLERRRMEEQIRESLQEKETLLQEIHHRVKNNMNVVSSLLSLHASNTGDEEVQRALRSSQGRIYAMAAVHESLYKSESLSEIDLLEYFKKLANFLIQTYSVSKDEIQLKISGESVRVNIDRASPLGLVLNELVSNSLKYAFPDERQGVIDVQLRTDERKLILTITDNGMGLPEGFDWNSTNTLGFKLVRNLVQNQLDGTVDVSGVEGTIFTITINLKRTGDES